MRRGRVLLLAAVLVAGFLLMRRALGLEFDPESVEATVAAMGVWGPLVYVGIVAFRVPLGLPSQLVLVGGGIVFGTLFGTLYGAAGLLASGVALFLIARYTGREVIESRIPGRLRPIFELAATRAGALSLAVVTAYPFGGPITVYNLFAGVTGMAFAAFVLAVGAGSLVRSATFTYFGSSIRAGEIGGILQGSAVLAAAVIVPLLFPRSRAWLLRALGRARASPEP
jgi:uncharacterized membrane protein YdjX (TVP38/TMEM64 family)